MKVNVFLLACLLLFTVPVGAEECIVGGPLCDMSWRDTSIQVTLSYWPTEEELGHAIVSAASQHDPCLARMEEILRQLELDIAKMEKQRSIIPMWELHAMLQRRPMWTEVRHQCWKEKP